MAMVMDPQAEELSIRGERQEADQLFSYVPLEERIPGDHPLRSIRGFVHRVLRELSPRLEALYARTGRPSPPPEQLLKALLLQVLYSVRSERMLGEQLRYNLLSRWFVGLGMDERVWVPTTFTKHRDRLLGGDLARAFFSGVVAEARKRRWLSEEHVTVDGTLLEAYASQKSFRPKGEPPDSWPRSAGGGRGPEVNFRGEKRSHETHESRTDPDARLARKKGKESRLSYLANTLMENRSGLIVDAEVRHATGTAESEAALATVDRLPARRRRRTLGAEAQAHRTRVRLAEDGRPHEGAAAPWASGGPVAVHAHRRGLQPGENAIAAAGRRALANGEIASKGAAPRQRNGPCKGGALRTRPRSMD